MELAEKPDLRELVGVAVNASNLVIRTSETALERVAALGAATLAVQLGADRQDLPVAACRDDTPRPENAVAGELAAVLWHVRYGCQHNALPQAVTLFAAWLSARSRYARLEPERRLILPRLAARALHEWLSDRCVACAGSGKEERTRTGSWVKPRGSMQRNAVFRTCRACFGSKRRTHSDRERARSLGLEMKNYESERWAANIRGAVAMLGRLLANRLYSPLTAELERRKRRR